MKNASVLKVYKYIIYYFSLACQLYSSKNSIFNKKIILSGLIFVVNYKRKRRGKKNFCFICFWRG